MIANTTPRSLHALRFCGWCVAGALVEVALYLSYRGHDARYHWFAHFFVGASFALLVMTVVALTTRRPVPLPLVWIVFAHVFAMVPDLLFAGGTAHEGWMDLFLGHVSSHYIVGRNVTWYVVFVVSLGIYLLALDRLREHSSR